LGVLSWGGCRVIPSSPSSVVVSCRSPPFVPSSCTCTPYPPREQLLVAVVWASPHPPPGVPPAVVVFLPLRLPSPSSPFPFISPLRLPSHRLSLSFHPSSTPWAVACGAGGGWCVVRRFGWCWAGFCRLVWCWCWPWCFHRHRGVLGPFLVVVGPWCSFSSSSVGGPLVCPLSSLSLLHPVFTPRAVAHGSGGGCWLSSVLWGSGMGGRLLLFPCCHSPVVVPTSFCIGTRCW
jgi:hypothetical protein